MADASVPMTSKGYQFLLDELKRQSEAGEQGLRFTSGEAEMITIEGRVNLDELTMAVVGSLAGGP